MDFSHRTHVCFNFLINGCFNFRCTLEKMWKCIMCTRTSSELILDVPSASPAQPGQPVTPHQSCWGRSSCVQEHPGWWNVSSPSQNKLCRPPPSCPCPSPPGWCPEPTTGTCTQPIAQLLNQMSSRLQGGIYLHGFLRAPIGRTSPTSRSSYQVSLFFSFASLSYFSRVRFSTMPVKYLTNKTDH